MIPRGSFAAIDAVEVYKNIARTKEIIEGHQLKPSSLAGHISATRLKSSALELATAPGKGFTITNSGPFDQGTTTTTYQARTPTSDISRADPLYKYTMDTSIITGNKDGTTVSPLRIEQDLSFPIARFDDDPTPPSVRYRYCLQDDPDKKLQGLLQTVEIHDLSEQIEGITIRRIATMSGNDKTEIIFKPSDKMLESLKLYDLIGKKARFVYSNGNFTYQPQSDGDDTFQNLPPVSISQEEFLGQNASIERTDTAFETILQFKIGQAQYVMILGKVINKTYTSQILDPHNLMPITNSVVAAMIDNQASKPKLSIHKEFGKN